MPSNTHTRTERERERERERENQAFGGEIAEAQVAEDDLRGVKEVEGAAEVTAEKEGLSLHVNVSGIAGECGDFVGEEDGGRVEVLAHTVSDHSSEPLYLFFPHFFFLSFSFKLSLRREMEGTGKGFRLWFASCR